MKLGCWVFLGALAGVAVGCAGARTARMPDGDTGVPQFDIGRKGDGPLGFPDISVDGPQQPPGDGPQKLDGPPPLDGPRGDYTVDSKPGVTDEDKDGHCAPGQKDPNGICQSFNDCDDKDPARHPGATETCANRGVDNDCDGDNTEVDENNDGVDDIGEICATGLPGVCSTGKKACINNGSKLSCVPDIAVGSQNETCNKKDDNCDGKVDNGNLCGAGESCVSGTCRCGTGAACSGSATCCGSSCVNTASSTSNCGGCGVSCGSGETCSSSRCHCGSTSGSVGGGSACGGSSTCSGTSCSTPCNGSVNVALSATPTSSGGGDPAYGYGPDKMNDGKGQATCSTDKFHWVRTSSGTPPYWIRYSWSQPVTVGRVVFDTVIYNASQCGASAGRTLAGGTLQYLSGSTWVNITTISGQTNDWSRTFAPVTTTSLRLLNTVSYSTANPVIIEWQVFCQ